MRRTYIRRVIFDLDQMRLGPAGSGAGYVLPPPHGISQYYLSTPPSDMSSVDWVSLRIWIWNDTTFS